MRNKLLTLSVCITLLASCRKFDQNDPTILSEELVVNSYEYTIARANAVYANLDGGFESIDGAMLASASDEAEHTQERSAVHKFNTGAWNAFDNPDDKWGYYYSGIRKANQFLETADSVDLDIYRLNPDAAAQQVYQTRLAEIKRCKYESRFLRAWFYFELIRRYGGVPIFTRSLELAEDRSNIKRNTLAECIQFISSECDSVANQLPVTYSNNEDLGRVTKGAALALKSRLLLYAASDLFNTTSWAGGFGKAELISLTGDRNVKYKAAADAAKAVIDLNTYTLATDYTALFSANNFTNREIIFIRRNGQANSFERSNLPIGYDPGQSGTTPSQNLVDRYELKDGSTFDWSNPTHTANPYANRDPRLAFTILTNNTDFKGRLIESYTGGLDGKGIELATRTGYYIRKYINPSINLLQNQSSVHSWVYIRLAEIYLNYAEALNEYDPGNIDIAVYVNRVRTRQGVNMPPLPDGLTQAEMRARIRKERQVELAFEGHRFWDVRRWMIASETLGVPLRGLEITRMSTGFEYRLLNVESRTFEPKMYLYPIPQTEILLSADWIQNPLW